MKLKALLLLVAVTAVSACATLTDAIAVRNVEKAVELINSKDAEALARNSGKPFIFEGEALFRAADIRAVWQNVTENGFTLENPVIVEARKADSGSYAVFSESEEMEIIFRKYVPGGATLAIIETGRGVYQLLLGRGVGGYPSIIGITGF